MKSFDEKFRILFVVLVYIPNYPDKYNWVQEGDVYIFEVYCADLVVFIFDTQFPKFVDEWEDGFCAEGIRLLLVCWLVFEECFGVNLYDDYFGLLVHMKVKPFAHTFCIKI